MRHFTALQAEMNWVINSWTVDGLQRTTSFRIFKCCHVRFEKLLVISLGPESNYAFVHSLIYSLQLPTQLAGSTEKGTKEAVLWMNSV